jgi:hypothetical protein
MAYGAIWAGGWRSEADRQARVVLGQAGRARGRRRDPAQLRLLQLREKFTGLLYPMQTPHLFGIMRISTLCSARDTSFAVKVDLYFLIHASYLFRQSYL